MTLAGRLRHRRIRPLVAEQARFYDAGRGADAIAAWQLDRFNESWRELSTRVPYLRRLRERRPLPGAFSSWEELRAALPPIDRGTLQSEGAALCDERRPPDFWRSTGGSTAEPIRVPGWRSEAAIASADLWYARGWFGVRSCDRLFLLWGHSHRFGRGPGGRLRAARRDWTDRLLGYERWSAYDLGDAALRRAADALLAFRPAWVLGYAVALDRFARVNRDRAAALRGLGLRVAVATAESFPSADSAARVAEVLGCPVRMEYGSVETGPLAHQTPEGDYFVFWRRWAVESLPSAEIAGADEIVVTSLYPRRLPLIRYRVGDVIRAPHGVSAPLVRLDGVVGRSNDWIRLGDTVVHSEAFTHAVKDTAALLGYQIVQSADDAVRLEYVADAALDAPDEAEIRRRLGLIHPQLGGIALVRRRRLEQTPAGKSKPIRREVA